MQYIEFSEKDKHAKSSPYRWPVATMAIVVVVYLLNYKYYAAWWVVLISVNLCVSLLYIKVLFKSIVFWAKNAKIYQRPYLPLGINIATALLICFLPSRNLSKHYHDYTVDLSEYRKGCDCKLYLETYMVFGGGAWGGDVDSMYLTDSLSFRKYLGTYDEGDGMIITNCNGDKITIQQLERTERPNTARPKPGGDIIGQVKDGFKTTAYAVYSLQKLKKKVHFD